MFLMMTSVSMDMGSNYDNTICLPGYGINHDS